MHAYRQRIGRRRTSREYVEAKVVGIIADGERVQEMRGDSFRHDCVSQGPGAASSEYSENYAMTSDSRRSPFSVAKERPGEQVGVAFHP